MASQRGLWSGSFAYINGHGHEQNHLQTGPAGILCVNLYSPFPLTSTVLPKHVSVGSVGSVGFVGSVGSVGFADMSATVCRIIADLSPTSLIQFAPMWLWLLYPLHGISVDLSIAIFSR